MSNERYHVTVYLKAGQSFTFRCSNLTVELDESGQKLTRFEWREAEPRVMFVHLDNIGAITYTTDFGVETGYGYQDLRLAGTA